jgi:hypothetical protein
VLIQFGYEVVGRIKRSNATRGDIRTRFTFHLLPTFRPKPGLSSVDRVLRDELEAPSFTLADLVKARTPKCFGKRDRPAIRNLNENFPVLPCHGSNDSIS